LLKVLTVCNLTQTTSFTTAFKGSPAGTGAPAEATWYSRHGWEVGPPGGDPHSVMILPQVHLRNGS